MIHYMLQIQKYQYVLCDFKKDTPRLNFRRLEGYHKSAVLKYPIIKEGYFNDKIQQRI